MPDTTSPELEQPFDPDAAARATAYLDVLERVLPGDPDVALVWDDSHEIVRLTRADLRQILAQRAYAKDENVLLAERCADWRGKYEEQHARTDHLQALADERARTILELGDQLRDAGVEQ